MSDEARAVKDVLAFDWATYRKDYEPNPDHYAAAHKAFRAGWEVRAERDAERIRELEAEVERLRERQESADLANAAIRWKGRALEAEAEVARLRPLTEAQAARSAEHLARAEVAEAKLDAALEHIHRCAFDMDDGAQTADVVYADALYAVLDGEAGRA